ncbi:hypothetical protein V2S66_18885 [Streptomyces sp. V4-01]|uniref:Uncharacterized protein n=1 Tax=Actinacidiphila polyblastidii TaxID=3110430 RepID=A0ABU7PDZ3_9ACTN|nr:hypothetical protein [Streptomyces sp. V4-01]
MICSVSTRTTRAGAFFTAALGPDARPELPLGERVIGHWPTLDEVFGDRHTVWLAENWVQYFEVPLIEYPFAVGPGNDRAAVFHLQVRLHPDDRTLTAEDLAMIVQHLAWTAGIIDSDGFGNCRWVAIQSASDRVDLIANLINDSNGTWTHLSRQLHQALADAAHDIEDWMDLESTRPGEGGSRHPDVTMRLEAERGITVTVHTHRTQVRADVEDAGFTIQDDQTYVLPAGTPTDEAKRRAAELVGALRSIGVSVLLDPDLYQDTEGAPGPDAVPTGTALLTGQITDARRPAQLAGLISAITDDRLGDLPRLRRFAETAAAWAAAQTGPAAGDAEHRLEWIARRLQGIQEDLHGVAQILTEPPATPRHAAGPPPPVAGDMSPGLARR